MTDNTCPCGAPSPHAALCDTCHQRHRLDLRAIAALWPELESTIAKQGAGSGARVIGKTQPLPINLPAADLAWDARNTLTTWARTVLETWQNLTPPGDRIADIATWLHDASDWYVKDPWVIELADEIADCRLRIVRTIDRPADPRPLGPCPTVHAPEREHSADACMCLCHTASGHPCDLDCQPQEVIAAVVCGEPLKATPEKRRVKCPTCGVTHDVEVLKARYLATVADLVVPMSELLALFGAYTDHDRSKLQANVRQWAKRGRIVKRGVERDGKVVTAYRVGEVLSKLSLSERKTA